MTAKILLCVILSLCILVGQTPVYAAENAAGLEEAHLYEPSRAYNPRLPEAELFSDLPPSDRVNLYIYRDLSHQLPRKLLTMDAHTERSAIIPINTTIHRLHLDLGIDDSQKAGSSPAPRTTKIVLISNHTVQQSKPSVVTLGDTKNSADKSNLEVQSVGPIGEIGYARVVTIVFSCPMVSPSETGKADSKERPVTITPPLPAHWTWLDQQTLVIRPLLGHIPFASKYDLSIPAGVRSLDGRKLNASKTWQIQTERPHLTNWPSDWSGDIKKFIVPIICHQPLRADSVLSHVHVFVDNKAVPLRLATRAEIKDLSGEDTKDKYLIALIPTFPLPADSKGVVVVEPGIESSEGPRRGTDKLEYKIATTSEKLRLASADDSVMQNRVRTYHPGEPLFIDFVGPYINDMGVIDRRRASADMFSVSPPIESMRIKSSGNNVVIFGNTVANTEYTIKISGRLPGYECTLGDDIVVKLKVGTSVPTLITPSSSCVIASEQLPIYSINAKTLQAKIYALNAQQFTDFRIPNEEFPKPSDVPLLEKTFIVDAAEIEKIATSKLDLRPVLERKIRQCLLMVNMVEPLVESTTKTAYEPVATYSVRLQLTDLNATSFSSSNAVNCIVTDHTSGKFVDDADAELIPAGRFDRTEPGLFANLTPKQTPMGIKVSTASDTAIIRDPENGYSPRPAQTDSPAVGSTHVRPFPVNTEPKSEGFIGIKTTSPGHDADDGIVCGDRVTTAATFLNSNNNVMSEEPVSWTWWSRPAQFTPGSWSEFIFGHSSFPYDDTQLPMRVEHSLNATTDSYGESKIVYKISRLDQDEPVSIQLQATRAPSTVNARGSSTSFIVYPSQLCVGLKASADRTSNATTSVKLDCIVTGIGGDPRPGTKVKLSICKVDAASGTIGASVLETSLISDKKPVPLHLDIPLVGRLAVKASVTDQNNRISQTSLHLFPDYADTRPTHSQNLEIFPDKPQYQPGDLCTLFFSSPFQKSEGVLSLATDAGIKMQKISLTQCEARVPVELLPSMNGFYSGIVKLYDTTNNSNEPSHRASAAEGIFYIRVLKKQGTAKQIPTDYNYLHASSLDGVPGPDTLEDAKTAIAKVRESSQSYSSHCGPAGGGYPSADPASTPSFNAIPPLTVSSTFPRYAYPADRFSPYLLVSNNLKTAQTMSIRIMPKGSTESICSSTINLPPQSSHKLVFDEIDLSKLPFQVILKTSLVEEKITFETSAIPVQSAFDSVSPQTFSRSKEMLLRPAKNVSIERMKIVTSNSLLTPLAVAAERLIAKKCDTVDNLCARIITVGSLRTFICDAKNLREYDAVLKSDAAALTTVLDGGKSSWIKNAVHTSARLESPFTQAQTVLAHAVAVEHGYCALIDRPNFTLHVENLVHVQVQLPSFKDPEPGSLADAITYGAFCGSRLLLLMDDFNKSQRANLVKSFMDTYLQEATIRTLPIESICWLSLSADALGLDPKLIETIKSELKNRSGDLHPTSSEQEDAVTYSSTFRKQCILLLALLHADPANKSIEPLVHIINARLGAGDYRWDGDVAIASMALTKYCDTQTKTAAAGSTSVSAGTKEAIKYTFVNGRSQIGTTTLNMPTSAAAIIVNDTGTAAFTHAVTASLTPISLADSAQKTAGFTVLRRYEASDHADHVWQDSEGIWHAKAGSDLKAVITFVPDKFITRAILKDNFPAGLTPYWNKLPQQENYHRPINDQWSLNWDYSNLWPQATDHECNSVQAYGSNLPTNEYHFSYKLRASTPGTFVVAPAEIVCPYDNNCFGRSAGDRFIVEQ